jgi:hypothetical protein
VNHWITVLAILASLSASHAVGDDFTTLKGKEYKNAKVSRVEADGVVLVYKSGVVKVYFDELPEQIQKRFGYDPAKAENERKSLEEKRIEEQKSAERQRVERDEKAEADLKQAEQKFQAAERRAGEAYESAAKGILSGQVFISTTRGENFKFGAVKIALFGRDAIDTLLPAIKKNADYKIEQLGKPVADAKAAQDRAEADRKAATDAVAQAITTGHRDHRAEDHARDSAREAFLNAQVQYSKLNDTLNFCYSGGFYFALFRSAIRTAETDADGKFSIEVPQTGAFVIAAEAKRSVEREIEHYYWLQPVTLEGQQQIIQNLSNNNLTSAAGTSSLLHTQERVATRGR